MSDESPQSTRSNQSGGVRAAWILAIAILAGGVIMLSRWDTLPGLFKAVAVMLVVLATLLLLPLVALLAIKLYLKRALGDLAKSAQDMLGSTQAMYSSIHEFRAADEDDFDGLDTNYYASAQRELEGQGFRHLGDVVDQTIEENSGLVAVIRVMASADGTTTAGVYHFAPAEGEGLRACDLSTEFSDGSFLLTSNTEGTDLMTPPPQLVSHKFPRETSITELLNAHKPAKQNLLSAKPGVTALAVNTLAEALDSEKRQQAVKNAFRKDIGFIESDEIKRIAKTIDPEDETLGDVAANAVEREKKRQE